MWSTGEKRPRIQLVLFDLDNTLFDHYGSAAKALDVFLGKLGITATE